jgi:hypothetical protein
MITQHEYWFLDLCVESEMPLHLVGENMSEVGLNRRTHGLPQEQVVIVLTRLFERGDIEARYRDKSNVFQPSRDLVAAALASKEHHLYYGLTQQGGTRWESASRPDWDRYLAVSIREREGTLKCRRKDIIETYIEQVFSFRGIELIPGTDQWSEVHPWPATYWKQLPSALRLRFLHTERAALTPTTCGEYDTPATQWVEATDLWANWYTPLFSFGRP